MIIKKALPLLLAMTLVFACGESGPKVSDADEALQKQFGELAAMNGLEELKVMLQKNPSLVHANINGKNQERPLHWAALSGNVDVVNFLLDNGAEINAVDAQQMTPLHWAAWQGQLEVTKVLVTRGAEINEISRSSQTPLDRAINDGKPEVEKYLESIGAKEFKDLTK
ncbi:MAG: ankyrin repeat domain-containing protein [Ignavibacterium sp.]|nr:MAG: ankyrin repeat domain-containing protein [Ignavibacterium sp.]